MKNNTTPSHIVSEIPALRRSGAIWLLAGAIMTGSLSLPSARADQSSAPAKAGDSSDPYRSSIENKLKTLILPSVDFDDIPLEEAIDSIRVQAKALDAAEADPARKGVNLKIFGKRGVQYSRVTLKMKDVSVGEALKGIATAAGAVVQTSPIGVTLAPLGSPEPPPMGKTMGAAAQIFLPRTEIDSESLGNVVATLNKASSGKGGPSIELSPKAEAETEVKDLRLGQSSVAETVVILCGITQCKYTEENGKIVISPR